MIISCILGAFMIISIWGSELAWYLFERSWKKYLKSRDELNASLERLIKTLEEAK